MRFAVDGIPLYLRPNAIGILHVLEVLEAIAGVPSGPLITVFSPGKYSQQIPDGIRTEFLGEIQSEWDRIGLEQRTLPQMAAQSDEGVLLSIGSGVSLGSSVPVVSLESLVPEPPGRGLSGRLRWSLGEAGRRGASLRLAYSDLGPLEGGVQPLPPFVSSTFRATPDSQDSRRRKTYDLPSDYVLSVGLRPEDAEELLAAWTWVEGSVGDVIPLLIMGLEKKHFELVRSLARSYGVDTAVRLLPDFAFEDLPAIYRGASALLHLGPTRFGQELRWALAAGVPVAAPEGPVLDPILGDAAYLTQPGDARALGAACLTLLVEAESVAEELKRKGLERAVAFHTSTFARDLLEAIHKVGAQRQ